MDNKVNLQLRNSPIGVFDSGLGGLTVLKELSKIMPYEDFIYFGDTGRVPYGNRSNATIERYAKGDEAFLLSKNVKLLIAACGTVSSVLLDKKNNAPVPFFEVVSHAAKGAVESTRNGKIGIIATSATIKNNAYKTKIEECENGGKMEVWGVDCPLFVPLVEEGIVDVDDPIANLVVKKYIEPLLQTGIDTLILGCTHYPVLAPIISKIAGDNVTLINAGEYVAKAVKAFLDDNGYFTENKNAGKIKYYASDSSQGFGKVAGNLLGSKFNSLVSYININEYQ